MWPFSKRKNKSGEVAKKRMEAFVRNSGQGGTLAYKSNNKIDSSNEENINSIVSYIKDYAYRNLSVERKNVKVHVSKENDHVTIVTNIIYK